jgi:hypothetical protein
MWDKARVDEQKPPLDYEEQMRLAMEREQLGKGAEPEELLGGTSEEQ